MNARKGLACGFGGARFEVSGRCFFVQNYLRMDYVCLGWTGITVLAHSTQEVRGKFTGANFIICSFWKASDSRRWLLFLCNGNFDFMYIIARSIYMKEHKAWPSLGLLSTTGPLFLRPYNEWN